MKRVYVVFDRKAGECVGGLQVHRSDNAALRMFSDIASLPDSMVSRHPQDYEMRAIAEFDEELAVVTPLAEPVVIVTGEQFVAARDAALLASGNN